MSLKQERISIGTLTLLEDRIILFETDEHVTVGIQEMQEVRKVNHELSDGRPYCVMSKTGAFSSYSKEMLDASKTYEYSKNRIALAIIANNLAVKMMTNAYIRMRKPPIPTKSYRSEEEAINWLRKMRDDFVFKPSVIDILEQSDQFQ